MPADSYLPHFLRFLSEDSLKLKNQMTHTDWEELEHFNHFTQLTVLITAFVWAVTWFCCTQASVWRKERRRRNIIQEAVKRR